MNIKDLPFIIAGPCAAENYEQVFETAQALKQTEKVNVFRAGIWKPRTKPGSYEGPGKEGLKWLDQIQQECGFDVATEVATTHHVEEALKHNIKWLWIGARTTVNPFSMKELSKALQGTNATVLIKNPINADISLWIGAIERIKHAGINDILAIHRGFTSLTPEPYRFDPIWKIPLEIKKRFPEIPMICDPSHISGDTKYIESIAQTALDHNMMGLMIEVHHNPKNALVDKNQQLTPDEFNTLVDHLKKRKDKSSDQHYTNKLDDLRHKIDKLDYQILDIIKSRTEIVEEIAQLKYEQNIGPFQLDRFKKICEDRIHYGKTLGLSKEMIDDIFSSIHEDSVRMQSDLMKKF